MSLSCCLATEPVERSDSDPELNRCETTRLGRCCVVVGAHRSWSGNLAPPPYKHLNSGRKGHRQTCSVGGAVMTAGEGGADAAEPRLVRSGGMRRDWSFEDLRKRAAALKM